MRHAPLFESFESKSSPPPTQLTAPGGLVIFASLVEGGVRSRCPPPHLVCKGGHRSMDRGPALSNRPQMIRPCGPRPQVRRPDLLLQTARNKVQGKHQGFRRLDDRGDVCSPEQCRSGWPFRILVVLIYHGCVMSDYMKYTLRVNSRMCDATTRPAASRLWARPDSAV